MKKPLFPLLAALGALGAGGASAQQDALEFRPASVPLVVHDPYLSIWSNADKLTDKTTQHWTKANHTLTSMVRIDDKTYRLMGDAPAAAPALPQQSVRVYPTRTVYNFGNEQARVKLTFTTPALPDDLDILSRPLTYLTWEVSSADDKPHKVSVFFSAAADLTVNKPSQSVTWARATWDPLTVMRIGTDSQSVLGSGGDDHRIDWGYVYVAALASGSQSALAGGPECFDAFVQRGGLPAGGDDLRMPRAAGDDMPVAALTINFGDVTQAISRHAIIAYDDVFSINYLGRRLKGYWKRNGMDITALLKTAESEYVTLQGRCERFDDELMADLRRVGGEKYAAVCALAYRQGLGGNKVAADANGLPLMFPKENTSNGCIATVDVIYPMSPQFFLFSPTLAKASVATVLNYAESAHWKYPFAPHDIGTYPKATAQVYGGGENGDNDADKMPVEECGNMIVLLGVIARLDGNAEFASRWWKPVTKWVNYLDKVGYDPERQLCTDDFAGRLAHNANLSVKAIEAIAAYGMMCEMRGEKTEAQKWRQRAREMAGKWVEAARADDHYELAFGQSGSWSQKYNLVWDKLIGLDAFPPDIARKEIAFYKTKLNRFGLPLDSRKLYTKTDWTLWTATMAESLADFKALSEPIFDFVNQTGNRAPFSDWYWTDSARVEGFIARPVIGGLFIKMLSDPATWRKWSTRDPSRPRADAWAIGPTPPKVSTVVADSRAPGVGWHYTTEQPADDSWQKVDFDDTGWKQGAGGLGSHGTPGANVRTEWTSPDIWVRRSFTLSGPPSKNLSLNLFHDEDAEVYLNGVLAAKVGGYNSGYELTDINLAARVALKPGQNTIAIHCHQTEGGQFIDAGLVEVLPQ